MGNRTIRVNELVQREVSSILHTNYRKESVYITITEVDIAPDLRNGKIYYSVIGEENIRPAKKLLSSVTQEINQLVGKNIILKYTPKLKFVFDSSVKQALQTLEIIAELDAENENS